LVPCVRRSFYLSFSLLFLHIVAHSVDKDGGPLSLVGRLDKGNAAREGPNYVTQLSLSRDHVVAAARSLGQCVI